MQGGDWQVVVPWSLYSARLVVYTWQVQDDVVHARIDEVPFQPLNAGGHSADGPATH